MRAIVTLFAGLALCLTLAACNKTDTAAPGGPGGGDISLGSPTAKVTVYEYGSLGCPICAMWNNTIWPDFKAKYVDTGRVRYVMREQLTGEARISMAGFLIAHCAGKDKYYQVVDAVFRAIPDPEHAVEPKAALLKVAQQAGLSEQQFNTCIADQNANLAIQ
jgi:protein-disulfide isomerase